VTARRMALPVIAALVLGIWALWPSGGEPAVLWARTGAHTVRLTMTPASVGRNTVELDISDQDGRPVPGRTVTVAPAMPQMGHALPPSPATVDGPGRYRVTGLTLPMPGQWEITVRLADTEQAVFSLVVNG
jgi:nitrogen fixation protein FixH